jgi:hypothetical protein
MKAGGWQFFVAINNTTTLHTQNARFSALEFDTTLQYQEVGLLNRSTTSAGDVDFAPDGCRATSNEYS